jgi:hypothetical protein
MLTRNCRERNSSNANIAAAYNPLTEGAYAIVKPREWRGKLTPLSAATNRVPNSLHLVRLWSRIEKLTVAVFPHSPLRHGLR